MSATDRRILARPLTREAFAPFGDVIDTDWPHHYPINQGKAKRYHGLAKVEAEGPGAEVLISIFHGTPYDFPLQLSMVERHPLGSQAFIPLGGRRFLVVVCPDENGRPGTPHAFVTTHSQGVSYRPNEVLSQRDQINTRLLDVIENDVVPVTERGVSVGNKLFGAAILRKDDLSLVLAETNNEMENPLWHGEVHALKRFYEMPKADRPDTKDCIFIATHEPCSLCLSAITWTGFDNFYYLFSHEDSRDSFAIPHDLKILKEVFTLDPGGYNAENAYWKSYAIRKLVRSLPDAERRQLDERIGRISARYDALSAEYQSGKADNDIPLN